MQTQIYNISIKGILESSLQFYMHLMVNNQGNNCYWKVAFIQHLHLNTIATFGQVIL